MNNLIYLPNASKIISLDDVYKIEKSKFQSYISERYYHTIVIKNKSNMVPPSLLYDSEKEMNEDFNVIVNNL